MTSTALIEPELHLLLDVWDEPTRLRRREALLASALLHAVMIVFLLLQPKIFPHSNRPAGAKVERHVALLLPPPAELTQKEPNRGPRSKMFLGEQTLPRPPRLVVPKAIPSPPPPPARARGELLEEKPPQLVPKPELSGVSPLPQVAPPPAVAAPPKLVLEDAGKKSGGKQGEPQPGLLAQQRPGSVIEGAVRDLSRWGQGVNLVGVRPRARVAVWVAAHYDSKGQGTSMAGRLLAVLLAGLGIVGLGLLGANRLFGSHGSVLAWLLAAALAFIGGLGVARGGFNDDSPGAVDNASGLATVLAVLDTLPRDSPVGVIFPDAEEFGLFGAKALVRERANLFEGTAVLNFDGIDDRGSPIAFVHRSGPTVDGIVNRLGARRVRWLPVLVDGLAFAKGARECVTFMRGDWGTARVVHTPRDTVDRLTLAGSREMAVAVAAVLGKRE